MYHNINLERKHIAEMKQN